MKIKNFLSIIFLMLSFFTIRAQGVIQILPEEVCWTTPSAVDSSLVRYWLISARVPFTENATIMGYVNASGASVDVSGGGTFAAGLCSGSGTGDGGDGDWAFLLGDNVYDPIFRQGRTMIFTQDTTHGFRVDSTFQFNLDGAMSIFDWQDGNNVLIDKGLLFSSENTTASTAGPIGNDDNKFVLASLQSAIHRRRLGILSFAGPDPVDGILRHGAFIAANVEDITNWSATSRGTELGFYVTESGDTIPQKTFNLKNDGRAYLNLYNLFDDGVPETLLGNSSGTGPISHHIIGGTAGPGKVITIDGAGTGIEWQTPAGGGTDDQQLTISNDTIYLEDGGFVILPSITDDQVISISNDTIYLEDGGFIVLPSSVGTDDQQLTISNDTIYLEDGGFVILPSITDDQVISISNDTVYLEDGGFIVLPPDDTGTDDQLISISNDTIYLEDGGFVILPSITDDQVISISNDTVYLEDGGFIVLPPDDTGTDDQLISISNDTIYLEDGGFVILPSITDDQVISISNDTVYLEDGGFIVLPPDDTGTDDQLISISNDTIYLEDGGFVILPSITDDQVISISNDTVYLEDGGFIVLPPDDTGTDDQLISISNDTIYLEDGGFVILPSITDDQVISISNDTIYLEDGGFVVLPSSSDTNIYNSDGALPNSTIRLIGFGNNASRYRYLDPDNTDQYFDLFNNSLNSGEAGLYILDDDDGSDGYLGEIDYSVYGVKTDATAMLKGSIASLINSNSDVYLNAENTSDLLRMFSVTANYRIGDPATPASLLQVDNTQSAIVVYDKATGEIAYKDEGEISLDQSYAHSENNTAGPSAVTGGIPQTLNNAWGISSTLNSSDWSYTTSTGRWTYSGDNAVFFVTVKMDVTTNAKAADIELELAKNLGGSPSDFSYARWVTSADGNGQHNITTNMIFSMSSGDYIGCRFESATSVNVTIQNFHLSIVKI